MLEDRISVMTDSKITLHGAGRTDAGVHARGMVANFTTASSIPCSGFLNGLNSMLPKDIRILQADDVENNFHSRYSATGKTYSYTLFTGAVQLPTERLYIAHYPGPFDDKAIAKTLPLIRGSHDFTSFEATGSRDMAQAGRGAVRTLFELTLSLHKSQSNTWTFSFTGEGFLRHMVRNLVGTLMDIGAGRITPNNFRSILESRNRENAGPTAPACGLTLEQVHYKPLSL